MPECCADELDRAFVRVDRANEVVVTDVDIDVDPGAEFFREERVRVRLFISSHRCVKR